MFDEEELPKKPVAVFTPAKLDLLSVAQMQDYIADMKGEIGRVESEISKRGGHKSKAELFFKHVFICALAGMMFITTGDYAMSENTASHDAAAKVTMYIYSGRENPNWFLNETDAAVIRSMLEGLPETDAIYKWQGGLGYQGVRVDFNAPDKTGYIIDGGTVTKTDSSGTTYFSDDNAAVEKRVLDTRTPGTE